MNKTAKLASVLTSALLFLAGMVFAQTDPGVQSAGRGTGATIIDPANDPNGFTAFFQDGLSSLPGRGGGFRRQQRRSGTAV